MTTTGRALFSPRGPGRTCAPSGGAGRRLHPGGRAGLAAVAWLTLVVLAGAAEAPRAFLWKAAGSNATVYMLGSLHIGKKDLYPLPPVVEKAFASADALVTEVPMDAENQAAAAMKMMAAANPPLGKGLRDILPPKVAARFDAYMKGSAMSAVPLERVRPWFAAIMITLVEAQKAGFDPANGIETHFLARADQRRRLALETIDQQVGLLSGMSEDMQVMFLDRTLQEAAKTGELIGGITAAWRRGDAEGLDKLLSEAIDETPEMKGLMKTMITDRNVTMTEKIDGYLKTKGTYFVIVGAGHFVGKEGIVALLRARGHKVEQQ